jgi:hypothetical protein
MQPDTLGDAILAQVLLSRLTTFRATENADCGLSATAETARDSEMRGARLADFSANCQSRIAASRSIASSLAAQDRLLIAVRRSSMIS